MKQRVTVKAESRLESHVRAWLNREAVNYDDGARGVLHDLQHGGCSSGFVGHLVYTWDAVAFFRQYRADIAALLAEAIDNAGCGPDRLFKGGSGGLEWDSADPLALDDANQNLLAWFGFEEAANRLAARQGIDE
jgi:hypothetical protein